MSNPWAGKRVLITGVCGTVGGELLRQISAAGPEEILGIDNNESELFFLRNEYAAHGNYHFYLCERTGWNGQIRVWPIGRGTRFGAALWQRRTSGRSGLCSW